MRDHNGMRPQDIVVLLKIISLQDQPWQHKDLAAQLFLSPAEISISLHRSVIARLINSEKKKVYRQTFLEFLQFGLPVVFPTMPGGMANGLYTAHSHPYMQQFFASQEAYIWPDVTGEGRGQSIAPLYKEVVKAALQDTELYKMLALLDVIRVGRTRELKVALEELKKMIQ